MRAIVPMMPVVTAGLPAAVAFYSALPHPWEMQMPRDSEKTAEQRYLLAARKLALCLAPLLSREPGDSCRAEEVSTARQTAHRLPAGAAEPAAPLFIESDANTPARLAAEPAPPAQAASPRPLMCCRAPQSAAPRGDLHPTLAALAAAVQPRREQTDAAPALPELRPALESKASKTAVVEASPGAFGEPETAPPAASEHPPASRPAQPKLISNPWARPESQEPPERLQWRTSQNRPVRLAKFNPPPPQGLPSPKRSQPRPLPSQTQPLSLPRESPSDLPSLDFKDREAVDGLDQPAPPAPRNEDHELIDSAGDEHTAGENPLRELDAGPAQRPARWSGLNPLR